MRLPLSVNVFDSMHELQYLFRARLSKSLADVHPELTFNEMRVLMLVGRQPGITQKDLVEQSHADKAQMARLLAQLQERGWLTRSASASDKRVRCLRLSQEGQELYARLRSLKERVADELVQGCSSSLQTQLLDLLQQFRGSVIANATGTTVQFPVSSQT